MNPQSEVYRAYTLQMVADVLVWVLTGLAAIFVGVRSVRSRLQRRRLHSEFVRASRPPPNLLRQWRLTRRASTGGREHYASPDERLTIATRTRPGLDGGVQHERATMTIALQSAEFRWLLVPHTPTFTHSIEYALNPMGAEAVIHRRRIPSTTTSHQESNYRGPDLEAPYQVHFPKNQPAGIEDCAFIASQLMILSDLQLGIYRDRIVHVRAVPLEELWDEDHINSIIDSMMEVDRKLRRMKSIGISLTPESARLAARLSVIARGCPHARGPTMLDREMVNNLASGASDPLIDLWLGAGQRARHIGMVMDTLPIHDPLLAVEVASIVVQPFVANPALSPVPAHELVSMSRVLIVREDAASLLAAFRLSASLLAREALPEDLRVSLVQELPTALGALHANPEATFFLPTQRDLVEVGKAFGMLDDAMMGGLALHSGESAGELALSVEPIPAN